MSIKYPTLLTPVRINNVVLKNRMISSCAPPHFTQGPEEFPSEAMIAYQRDLAKNGAAVVTFAEWNDPMQRKVGGRDSVRMPCYDTNNPATSNVISRMADEVHFYGTKMSLTARPDFPEGYGFVKHVAPVVDEKLAAAPGDDKEADVKDMFILMGGPTVDELPAERMGEVYEMFLDKLDYYVDCGYDMVSMPLGNYLNRQWNKRTDSYGGSLENRMRFPLELCRAIKERFGADFLIEGVAPGEEDNGYTTEELAAFVKAADGLIDIFQVREKEGALAHVTGYNSVKNVHNTLAYVEKIKATGTKVLIAPIAGYQDLEYNEKILREGRCDMICMGRAFICDPEYGKKAYEGRGEDVIPCIRCNKCHGVIHGPWVNFCSVNPKHGIAYNLPDMVKPAEAVKKVAVIGGGPAGMEAAMTAAERGHRVVLFEKSDRLGGQLSYADTMSFKWPIREFRDYLIRQLDKLGVDVRLNTEATPELVRAENFDAIIAATGGVPKTPAIEGIETAGVMNWKDVCAHPEKLGQRVVVVGGSELGVELAMHIADMGKDVTVTTRQSQIAPDASPLHSITMARERILEDGRIVFDAAWELYDNIRCLTQMKPVRMEPGLVVFEHSGESVELSCDSIVICGGTRSLLDEAMTFAEPGKPFSVIGDGKKVRDIRSCVREGYAAAAVL